MVRAMLTFLIICGTVSAFPLSSQEFSPRRITRSRPSCLTLSINKKSQNFADEILDALDTMLGLSPLAETDLKSSFQDLEKAQKLREQLRPPEDALQKPSVAVFFALLAIIPALFSIYAIQHGVRPFGL